MLNKEFDIVLKRKNIEQKELINHLSEKIKQLEEKMEKFEQWKNEIEKRLNGNKEENTKLKLIDSKIINKKVREMLKKR